MDVPPAHYETLAALYRETGRPTATVSGLERYVEFVESLVRRPRGRMLEQLADARRAAEE